MSHDFSMWRLGPRAEVVIAQEEDASDLATRSWKEDRNRKLYTGEEQ
jgi:hypothetical protein